jgi:hypothetical protein
VSSGVGAHHERNLVLVHTPRRQQISDFVTIKGLIAERAPDIEVFVVENHARHSVTRRQASQRPTLVFSPLAIEGFVPARGKIVCPPPRRMPKAEEIRRLASGGLRVPRTELVHPETRLDPDVWGPFTVLKPNYGFQGRAVRIVRTRDVRWVDPLSWPADDPRHGQNIVAQAFIDTGPVVESHRVMTIFGRPVYSMVSRAIVPRPDLDPGGEEPLDAPIASNAGDRVLELNYDADVIAYAKGTYRAVPEVPVHGVDLAREQSSGLIYVLEINPSGLTWHISSDLGRKRMRDHGIDYNKQFGSLDIIADALIDVTRREAE